VNVVSAGFIGNFKLGDNVNYNLAILKCLYECQASGPAAASLLRKPVVVLIGSICEATLHDLHWRMKLFTTEGVRGIAEAVITYVRGKQLDKFEHYIASSRKHGLLGPATDSIYKELEMVRKLRNRIHIQNTRPFGADESIAFSAARQVAAEQVLEKLLKYLAANNPRPASVQGHVADFRLPWNPHYP